MRIGIWQIAGLIAFLIIWSACSWLLGESRVPNPLDVLQAIRESLFGSTLLASRVTGEPTIVGDLIYTTERTIGGIIIGGSLGVLWGLVSAIWPGVGRVTAVPLEILRILPPLVVIPFFVMWFGPSPQAQFLIICFYAFVRLVVLSVEAACNIQPVLLNYTLTMGATRMQALRSVVLPAVLPELAGGARVVLAEAWGLQIIAELLGSRAGIGQVLMYLLPSLRVDYMVATMFWVTIVAVAVDTLVFVPLSLRLTRWLPRTEGAQHG
jgi:ABC-type nitrate/sulfonate/bicarbonate transport system permease component